MSNIIVPEPNIPFVYDPELERAGIKFIDCISIRK